MTSVTDERDPLVKVIRKSPVLQLGYWGSPAANLDAGLELLRTGHV